jgi:hypothetical protein
MVMGSTSLSSEGEKWNCTSTSARACRDLTNNFCTHSTCPVCARRTWAGWRQHPQHLTGPYTSLLPAPAAHFCSESGSIHMLTVATPLQAQQGDQPAKSRAHVQHHPRCKSGRIAYRTAGFLAAYVCRRAASSSDKTGQASPNWNAGPTRLDAEPERRSGLRHRLPAAAGAADQAEGQHALRGGSCQLAGDHAAHGVPHQMEARPAQVVLRGDKHTRTLLDTQWRATKLPRLVLGAPCAAGWPDTNELQLCSSSRCHCPLAAFFVQHRVDTAKRRCISTW